MPISNGGSATNELSATVTSWQRRHRGTRDIRRGRRTTAPRRLLRALDIGGDGGRRAGLEDGWGKGQMRSGISDFLRLCPWGRPRFVYGERSAKGSERLAPSPVLPRLLALFVTAARPKHRAPVCTHPSSRRVCSHGHDFPWPPCIESTSGSGEKRTLAGVGTGAAPCKS